MTCKWAVALVVAGLAFSALHAAAGAELEGFDDIEALQKQAAAATPEHTAHSLGSEEQVAPTERKKGTTPPKDKRASREELLKQTNVKFGVIEVSAAAFMVLFVLNLVRGRHVNSRIADAFTKAFAQPDGIFDKNFSMMGIKGELLMREAGNCFKFYASGRRHVQGLLATLNLKARQDILSLFWYILSPQEDRVTFEAFMHEASMPPIVMAVATPKIMRKLKDDQSDIAAYTKKLAPPKDMLPTFPADKLQIMAEHSTIVGELFSDPKVQAVFNPAGPYAKAFKYFRSLHFTNDAHGGAHKRVLRMTFALPKASQMEDIAPLVSLVPLFIDLVGSYKLSPELKKKAEAARQKVAEEKSKEEEVRKKRLEALAQRKMEKLAEEKARIARLPPAERQKAEEKLAKKQMEKAMRKRTIKM